MLRNVALAAALGAATALTACSDEISGASLSATESSSQEPAHTAEPPLLGSSRARSYASEFCDGQPDDTPLPLDPRELIGPGVNEGRHVAFNTYWQDCTTPADNPLRKAETCGEFRERATAGRELMRRGLATGMTSAADYYDLWRRWGLAQRPADFDGQLRERYGLPETDFHNPYPLPGEDPNLTDGGSGQLPGGLTQVRDADGRYTGEIGITCDICHSGELRAIGQHGASDFVSGLGANTADFQLLLTDVALPLPLGFNDSRGVTNAEGLSGLLIGLLDLDSLGFSPESTLLLQLPGNTSGAGDTKMPPWWNASHRPRKFWDGGFSYDATRLNSAILNAGLPLARPLGMDKDYNRWLRDKIEHEGLLVAAYVESLESPPWPGDIDIPLAEQGAILLHNKDLWAGNGNADIPRPASNGSCAGCHGVYSPRYAEDPAFLEDPRLKGMAGYISPIEEIRTDPQRLRGFTGPLREVMSTSWFAYPEGHADYVPPDDKNPLLERLDDLLVFVAGSRPAGACNWQGFLDEDMVGYLAPPLHGIWATAPYMHNASMPDIWSVLDPDSRPRVWQRVLSPGVAEERGLDTRWEAYDQDRMGWRFEALSCSNGGVPYMSCQPEMPLPVLTQLVEFINVLPGSLNSLGYQVRQPLGRQAIEARKIFNGYRFAKGNSGHDFTRVLTDAERRALIEYLKTL